MRWMRQPLGQRAVVRQEQQALGVLVQAAHRVHPHRAVVQQVLHRFPPPLVAQRRDIAPGLVEHHIDRRWRCRQRRAVDGNRIARRVRRVAQPGRCAVDKHAPGGDPLLRLAAGGQAAACDQLLKSFLHG